MNENIAIRPPNHSDVDEFIYLMKKSKRLHYPWVKPPLTLQAFYEYLKKYETERDYSFLVLCESQIAGVVNINNVVRGAFKCGNLGFYSTIDYASKGIMKQGLNLVMQSAFSKLNLHRLEANIQPTNQRSKFLVKKLGFKKEGFSKRFLFVDGEWRDHERWAITVEEFVFLNSVG